jgi:hypothetical protein
MTTPTAPRLPKGPAPGTHRRQANILTRRKAAELMAKGESPLDGLMDEVRWWKREITQLEATMRAEMAKKGVASILALDREGVVLNFFESKKEYRACCMAAATWVHPRLTPEKPGPGTGGVSAHDLSQLTDTELDQLVRVGRKIANAHGSDQAAAAAPHEPAKR